MHVVRRFLFLIALITGPAAGYGQVVTGAGEPAQLDVRAAGERSIRLTLKPVSFMKDFRDHPSLAARRYTVPALSVREITKPVQRSVGTLTVEVRANPLTVSVRNNDGLPMQEVVFESDGSLSLFYRCLRDLRYRCR
jgi:hypothetical protein